MALGEALAHEWKDIEYLLRKEGALSKIKVPFSHMWQEWSRNCKRNDIHLIQITLQTNLVSTESENYILTLVFIFDFFIPSSQSMALYAKSRNLNQLQSLSNYIFSFSTWPGLSGCHPCVFLRNVLWSDHSQCFLNKLKPGILSFL